MKVNEAKHHLALKMNGVKKDSLASQGSGLQLGTESHSCLPETSLGWGASDSVFLQSRTLERDLSLDNESGHIST